MNTLTKADVCGSCGMMSFCSTLEQDSLHLTQRILKKNEVLHHAGDKFVSLYAIREGALKSRVSDIQGFERIKYFYLKDEIYGFEAIYHSYYPYEARALCTTTVCELPYAYFLQLIQQKPLLLAQSLQFMSQQIANASYPQHHCAQQKVAAFLIDIARRLHKKQHETMSIPMVHQDIAHYLSLTAETVSRILSHLKKEKIISITKKRVQFLNLVKLQEIAS